MTRHARAGSPAVCPHGDNGGHDVPRLVRRGAVLRTENCFNRRLMRWPVPYQPPYHIAYMYNVMFMMRVLSTIQREGKGKESDLITVGGPPSPPPPRRPPAPRPPPPGPGIYISLFAISVFRIPKCVLVIELSCGPHLRIVSHMRTVIRTRIQSLFSGGFQGYSCTVAVISETDPPPRPVVKKRHTPVQRGNTGETTSGTGGVEKQ